MRLQHAREFDAVRRAGVRRQTGGLALSGRPNGLQFCRLGLSVGRAVGTAVERNRAKRLIRDAFRLAQRELPAGYDLVVSVRIGRSLTLAACRAALVDLTASIDREWQRGAKAPHGR
jgi:ribonuclease P protein component